MDDLYFVDKSMFIKDIVDGMAVLLYPRPRRFGKSLNLSMLKYFYDCREDNAHLFENLAISQEKDIMAKQGKYPVIFLTFKDVKEETYEASMEKIYTIISNLYKEHGEVLQSGFSYEIDKIFYEKIISKTASQSDFAESLKALSKFLYDHHKANPVILIDEYDTPIHAGFYHGYYEKMVGFMRGLLGGGLKDNIYLEKGVLTGILRVSRESIFSDLNNISVYSILSKKSADKFGFTDGEVQDMLDYFSSPITIDEIKENYDGYNFGGIDIYNPWSILNSIDEQSIGYYWGTTSSNNLIRTMCAEADDSVKQDLEIIIEGGKIQKYIEEDIIFPELKENKNAIWSFFLMCGYLRYDNYIWGNSIRDTNAELSIPNREILTLFVKRILPNWFKTAQKTDELINLSELLVNGDLEVFKREFTDYCLETFSYYDVSGTEPEKFYHGFVLGMLICLRDKYQIRSNRESGFGRYDVLLIPNDKKGRGIIFEFKKLDEARKETFEKAFSLARRQLAEQNYDQELKSQGVEDIVSIIAIFKGKEVQLDLNK